MSRGFGWNYFTYAEMRELEAWWKQYNDKRKQSPNWPPKWEPVKRVKRFGRK
jgi:hypothetical protein